MGGADHPRVAIREQHRGAVRGDDPERDAGPVGDEGVGARPRCLVMRAGDDDRIGRMDLVHRRQSRARRHRGDRAPAVFRHRRRIVVGSDADVQSRHRSCRHAPAPTEKAVRDPVQRARADHLDAHRASRMMSSSSAWLPTMKA
jgi:hypothetical protein